jgi:hypothetical protein
MKKTILTIMFAITSCILFGQARNGNSATDISAEFSERIYDLKSGLTKDGDYYIIIKTERASVLYNFDSDKVCTNIVIVPENDGALNFYVEMYNKQYVIISPTSWKAYTNQGIADIELVYPEGGGTYFIWK